MERCGRGGHQRRLGALAAGAVLASVLAGCGHAGGPAVSGPSLRVLTRRAQSELRHIEPKAGLRIAVPRWLPPGGKVVDVILSAAALPNHNSVMLVASAPKAGGGAVQIVEMKLKGRPAHTRAVHVGGVTLYEQSAASSLASHDGSVTRLGLAGGVMVVVVGVQAPVARLAHIAVAMQSRPAGG